MFTMAFISVLLQGIVPIFSVLFSAAKRHSNNKIYLEAAIPFPFPLHGFAAIYSNNQGSQSRRCELIVLIFEYLCVYLFILQRCRDWDELFFHFLGCSTVVR